MRLRFATHEKLPIHIIGRTSLESWPLKMPEAWALFQDAIADIQDQHNICTHAFMLMKNHYHWLCTYNPMEDPEVFYWFHELLNVSFYYSDRDKLRYVMEAKPKILEINNFPAYKEHYRYVYANPVSAGLVLSALDYPYSTLPYVLGKPDLEFHVVDNMNLIIDPIRTLQWINNTIDKYGVLQYHEAY